MAKKNNQNLEVNDLVVRRLDALLRLISEYLILNHKDSYNQGVIARTLKSSGLQPTEIASILGKKSATDVAPWLYQKKTKT